MVHICVSSRSTKWDYLKIIYKYALKSLLRCSHWHSTQVNTWISRCDCKTCVRQKSQSWWGGAPKVPPLAKKLLAIHDCWERESKISWGPWEALHLRTWPQLQEGSMSLKNKRARHSGTILILALGRQRQVYLCMFMARMVYIASLGKDKAM